MAYNLFAITTNEGRRALSQQLVDGEPAIQIVGFSCGSGGYSPSDPKTATPPDPNATNLEEQIFPLKGYETYDSVEWYNTYTPTFVCILEHNEAIGSLGEFGLWAKYITGERAGEVFLYAIYHSPLLAKTAADRVVMKLYCPF